MPVTGDEPAEGLGIATLGPPEESRFIVLDTPVLLDSIASARQQVVDEGLDLVVGQLQHRHAHAGMALGEMNADGLRIDISMYSSADMPSTRSPAHAGAVASEGPASVSDGMSGPS